MNDEAGDVDAVTFLAVMSRVVISRVHTELYPGGLARRIAGKLEKHKNLNFCF